MFRRILFPTDLSEFTLAALKLAVEEARRGGGTLYVLTVYGFSFQMPTVEDFITRDVKNKAREAAEELLAEYCEEHIPAELSQKRIAAEGSVYEVIVDTAAREKIDLIVMASHLRQGMDRFLLGSNAERVIRHSRCSVLLVRPAPSK